MTPTSEPPPGDGSARAAKALPLQLGLRTAALAVPAAPPSDLARSPRRSFGRAVRSTGIVLAVTLAAVALAAWALPRYVRRACIEQAAEHGIVLRIDAATFRAGGFRLLGATATFADVPGVRAQASEIELETSGLVPKTMTARGAEIFLDGPWSSVGAAFARWRASPNGGQAGTWAPDSLMAVQSRITWQGLFGENARLNASGVYLHAVWRGGGAEIQAASDEVTVEVKSGMLGPWAVHLDSTPRGSRLRVALDPAVPDSCTLLIISEGDRMAALDVAVHRSPLTRLGLPPEVLGLSGNDIQLEAAIHYTTLGPRRVDATATGRLSGVRPAFGGHPVTVAWEGSASGDPIVGTDLKKSRLAVGPLVGPVTGTLKTFEGEFRVDGAWTAGPVPCLAFEAPLGPGQPFEIGYALRGLAEAASRKKLNGDIRARAEFVVDSRDPLESHIALLPSGHCATQ